MPFKTRFLALLLLLPASGLPGQHPTIQKLLAEDPVWIDRYDAATVRHDQLLVHFEFGESKMLNRKQVKAVAARPITDVVYLYTRWTLSEEKQSELNRSRLEVLEKVVPGILDNPFVRWSVVEQIGPEVQKPCARAVAATPPKTTSKRSCRDSNPAPTART